jgi:hypothetical protein
MGKIIIAKVKPISFQMTELHSVSIGVVQRMAAEQLTWAPLAICLRDQGVPWGRSRGTSSPRQLSFWSSLCLCVVDDGVVCERALYLGTTYATRLGRAVLQRDPEHGRRVE